MLYQIFGDDGSSQYHNYVDYLIHVVLEFERLHDLYNINWSLEEYLLNIL
jgi:hypothetical protein